MRIEPYQRWVRGRVDGATVVDSKRAGLLYEPGRLPVYVFPEDDVRLESVPPAAVRRVDDLIHVEFAALDEWLEEDEPQIGHAPDPHHRIDVRATSRHVRISIDGQVVADTTRARALFETGLPVRWYIPREDVTATLEPTEHRTTCAYKGRASHFTVAGAPAVAWSYPDPLHDGLPVKDLIAFYDERVDVEVDGEPQARPQTKWSPGR
ncbi:MAG: DUF427 domain-containing protein [Thermoleophilaceae bacterium]|nr:DUF427 domain-containing protein [Thermoleophilaceae bacterium]